LAICEVVAGVPETKSGENQNAKHIVLTIVILDQSVK
jgi:hypothetical protein